MTTSSGLISRFAVGPAQRFEYAPLEFVVLLELEESGRKERTFSCVAFAEDQVKGLAQGQREALARYVTHRSLEAHCRKPHERRLELFIQAPQNFVEEFIRPVA
jgi:hypothetical protein